MFQAAGSGLAMKFAFYGPTMPLDAPVPDHDALDHRRRGHGGRHGPG
jgi:hypothetical protein